jgi:hypothetical protein
METQQINLFLYAVERNMPFSGEDTWPCQKEDIPIPAPANGGRTISSPLLLWAAAQNAASRKCRTSFAPAAANIKAKPFISLGTSWHKRQ